MNVNNTSKPGLKIVSAERACNRAETVVAGGSAGRLQCRPMNRPVTRHELVAALVSALRRHGVETAQPAIEVLSPPHHTARLFGVVLSGDVKFILAQQLARITGRLHPTVGEMWVVTEAESAALIQALCHYL